MTSPSDAENPAIASLTGTAGTAGTASETLTVGSVVADPFAAPAVVVTPSISGTSRVGQRLFASVGAWSGTPAPAFSYRWERCAARCTLIRGAVGRSYTLTRADTDARIGVLVTAFNRVGSARAAARASGRVGRPQPATRGRTGLVA